MSRCKLHTPIAITRVGVILCLVVGLAALGSSTQAGLIAHYALDTATGGATPDSTGLNGDGTLLGTVTSGGTGIVGGAFQFSGSSAEYVRIADPVFGLGQVTASVWIKPTTVDLQGPLGQWTYHSDGSWDRVFIIRTDSSGTVQEYVHNGSSQIGGNCTFATQSVSTTAFSLLTLTFDGQALVAYLNGEKSSSSYSFATSGHTLGEGVKDTVAIGGRGGSGQYSTGLIDDVSFFNERLSDGEIRSLFTLASHPGLNYDAGNVQTLFEVDADGTPRSITWLQWTKNTDLPTGHNDGDVWYDAPTGTYYVQFGTSGTSFGVQATVPEPSSLVLALGLGAAGLLALLRRRARGRSFPRLCATRTSALGDHSEATIRTGKPGTGRA